jgi:hypothetical protein
MIRNLKSSKMEKMLISEQSTMIPQGVILPDGKSRFAWDFLMLIQIIIFTFTIPFQASFLDSEVGIPMFVLDTCMDIIFIMDIFAHLRKFATMKDGILLVEPSEFRPIYMKSNFPIDVISSVPASTFGYFLQIQDRRYGVLRLFQFLRLRYFGDYLNMFVENVNSKTRFTISTARLRLMQIFFIVLFLCHWFACIFHLIGHIPNKGDTWLLVDESTGAQNSARYLRSFYWSLYTGKYD